jgi:hypothetical protein
VKFFVDQKSEACRVHAAGFDGSKIDLFAQFFHTGAVIFHG